MELHKTPFFVGQEKIVFKILKEKVDISVLIVYNIRRCIFGLFLSILW